MVNLGAMCTWCFPDASLLDIQKCHDQLDEAAALRKEIPPNDKEALRCYEEALNLATGCTPIYHYGVALAQNQMSVLQMEAGLWHRAESTLQTLARNSAVVDDFRMEACAYSRIGYIHIVLKDYALAVDSFQRSLNLSQQVGDLSEEITARINHANALMLKGRLSQAQEALAMVRDGKAAGLPVLLAITIWNHRWCGLLMGTPMALEYVQEFVLANADSTNVTPWTAYAVWACLCEESDRTENWSHAVSLARSRFAVCTATVAYILSHEKLRMRVPLGPWAPLGPEGGFRLSDLAYLKTVAENDISTPNEWTDDDRATAADIAARVEGLPSTPDAQRVIASLARVISVASKPSIASSPKSDIERLEME